MAFADRLRAVRLLAARQGNAALFRLAEQGQRVAHQLYLDSFGFADNGIDDQLAGFTIFSRYFHLDQLMVSQRAIDFRQDAFGQTMLAEQYDRLEAVGQAFEVLLLFGRQIHGLFFTGQG